MALSAQHARASFLVLAALVATMASGPSAGTAELQSLLADYVLTSWGEKDGLAEGTVWALAQDARGYLWVGSSSGLFRFDRPRRRASRGCARATCRHTARRPGWPPTSSKW
jgi:ligand-binding sensor domain-containing protein